MKNNKVLDLVYIKRMCFFLKIVGAWPSDIFGAKLPLPSRFQRAIIPYQALVIVSGGLYHIYTRGRQSTFLDMGHMIITTFLAFITCFRGTVTHLQIFKILLKKFVNEFHLMHFTHKGAFYKEMNKTVDKISQYYTTFSIIVMALGVSMFNIGPMIFNYKNIVLSNTANYSLQYSVHFSFPAFNQDDHFTFSTIYNLYLSNNCSTLLCGLDLLLFLMIFQIIGHVYILRHNLESFPIPKTKVILKLWGDKQSYKGTFSSEKFDEEENELIRSKLVQCVEHHNMIISFTDDLSETFGPILAISYAFHMVACCLLLLECSDGGFDALISFGALTCFVFGQLIQMSVMFELLGSVTEKLKDSIYDTPWESMSVGNQRTVFIILHRMQDNVSLKALGLAAVGVSTMTGILKTTFSYYAFLHTMGKK